MTKEQWLENMTSNNPDYEGLLQHLDATHDRKLAEYLTRELHLHHNLHEFIRVVYDDNRTDFLLTDYDLEFVKKFEEK